MHLKLLSAKMAAILSGGDGLKLSDSPIYIDDWNLVFTIAGDGLY